MLITTGVVTSPNYPAKYPPHIEKTEKIEVEIGKVLRLEFTRFDVSVCDNCTCDHVEIKDGDGKTLMEKSCGYSSTSPSSSGYFQPPVIVTNTNTVEIFFHTDATGSKSGWRLIWAAVIPGLKTLLTTSTYHCLFNPSPLTSLISASSNVLEMKTRRIQMAISVIFPISVVKYILFRPLLYSSVIGDIKRRAPC